MLPFLLAALTLTPLPVDGPVLDVRVADLDADGAEDVIAVTKEHLYLWKGGRGPAVRRPAPPLTVVGRGRVGVVRDGVYRDVADPFGAWTEGESGVAPLLARLGATDPALLRAPGDLDGDGRDDPLLATRAGYATPRGLVPFRPEARLDIGRNETFGVSFEIPVPVVGNWTGGGREFVLFHDADIVAHKGVAESGRLHLPIRTAAKEPGAIRRNHVFLEDIDGDGRLDLLLVVARGSTELFAAFEATARFWPGGRVYSEEKQGFYRPRSTIKVAGALLRPALTDLDGDGDLDLVLSTINTSILAAATGTAPGTYDLFAFEDGKFVRKPRWRHQGPVPLSVFTDDPRPPVVFLPDFDGDGRPEAIALGETTALLAATEDGDFEQTIGSDLPAQGPGAVGRRIAAFRGDRHVLVVAPEAAK